MTQESTFVLRKVYHGVLHFATVKFVLETNDSGCLTIITNYGKQPENEPALTNLPENGYNDWKKGILHGIEYAYSKLNCMGLTVTIKSVTGSHLDTTPTHMAYAAFKAVTGKLEHSLSQNDLKMIDELVFSCWQYQYNALPDFNKLTIT